MTQDLSTLSTDALNLDLPSAQQLEAAADIAARAAEHGGASAYALAASAHTGLSLALREQAVESLEFQRDRELGITVYMGQHKGHAATADFRPEAIAEAVQAACAIAAHTQDDAANGLPDAAQLAQEFPDLDLDHPTQWSMQQLLDCARSCEQRGLDAAAVQASDGMHVSASRHISLLRNSLDFQGWRQSSDYSLSLSLIGEDPAGKRRDYWYAHDLKDTVFGEADHVADTAAARVARSLNPRQPQTGPCAVIFPPELARGLFHSFLSAISGGALYRRSSFLLDALDTAVFPGWMQMHQRPLQPGRIGSASFDAEGVATRNRELVTDGIVRGWLLGSYSARKLGLQTTGNAGGAQRIEIDAHGPSTIDEMMQEAGQGLLLTSLMGQGVKLTTGDYSRGATGIWFENGAPAYAVDECTIAGNLRDIFASIAAVGTDQDLRSGLVTGSVLVPRMMVAGQ